MLEKVRKSHRLTQESKREAGVKMSRAKLLYLLIHLYLFYFVTLRWQNKKVLIIFQKYDILVCYVSFYALSNDVTYAYLLPLIAR